LYPNSKALIVSGKVIDRAMLKKGGAIAIAANGRNYPVIEGTLLAAQRADAAVIIEIAKSEATYCLTNMWNLARRVDALMNQWASRCRWLCMPITTASRTRADFRQAKVEIPTLFEAGITSIAIDASHMPDDENLMSNLELNPLIPAWAGLETEVGEIKGKFRPVHPGRGPVPDPGAQRPRHFSRLDRPEQRHRPRHPDRGRGHPGRSDR
jgi:fructose-bisphosphate aldolase class II